MQSFNQTIVVNVSHWGNLCILTSKWLCWNV